MPPSAAHSAAWPRILSEQLATPAQPLALLLRPGPACPPAAVAARAAGALLDRRALAPEPWPAWLAPHQATAAARLKEIIGRWGGALLADAAGLGKSYVALAVAAASGQPATLMVPAVLVPQWRALAARLGVAANVITHESLSAGTHVPTSPPAGPIVVDEAHHFRNAETRRYRALARLTIGHAVLLVTATPVHNRLADLLHLYRLFLRDDALASLGVPSLRLAARGGVPAATIATAAARLTVARSRRQAATHRAPDWTLAFPRRAPGLVLRVAPVAAPLLTELVAAVSAVAVGTPAAALLRLVLLRRLASSLPALRASLERQAAFFDLARDAAQADRGLSRRDFAHLFPRADELDMQLALFPIVLEPGAGAAAADNAAAIRRALAAAHSDDDPKARALARLLADDVAKTIVFCDARATVRHLARLLRTRLRVAALVGEHGWLGADPATRRDVLRAFAPRAQGAPPPGTALAADVLITTDVASEGLNLQDAARVVHYDLPWSPARLAQRVGRADRLGSTHAAVATVTLLPPEPLERALRIESRLALKARRQRAAGAAAVETPRGAGTASQLDWCDRLDALSRRGAEPVPAGAVAAVAGVADATVLVIQIGDLADAFVVEGGSARSDPARATGLLQRAADETPRAPDDAVMNQALAAVAPLVATRLAALEAVRWRSPDRDRFARRLLPLVLHAAHRAARAGDASRLATLDQLVYRLSRGMTAGEELLLADLVEHPAPLGVRELLGWHARLPPLSDPHPRPDVTLIAALQVRRR
jgi:superfamily II DNA or RNA helicase